MNRTISVLTVVLILLLYTVGFAQDAATALCQQHVQSKQFDAAVTSCSAAMKTNPSMGTLGRALAYIGKVKWDEAITDLNSLIRLEPQNAMAYAYRGGANQQKSDYRAAVNDYERAVQLEPRFEPQVRSSMALARELAELSVKKKVPLLEERAAIVLMLEANNLRMARAMNALNKKSKAEIEANDQAILDKIALSLKSDPYNGGTYKLRGDIYVELDKWESAMNDYTRAIVVDPTNISNYESRAKLQEKMGNYAFALADYNKMIELKPLDKAGYLARAHVYEELKNDDLALRDLTKIIELNPVDHNSYSSRFHFYFSRNRDDLALADVTKLLELRPDDGNGNYLRCQYHHKKGNYEAAVKDCSVTVGKKEFLLYEMALIQRVESYLAMKKFDAALADLTEAAKSQYSPADDIAARRGRVFLAQGKREAAIAEFNGALTLNPENEMARKELGKLGIAPKD